MKAVIMAGGEGSRLRPLTCDKPKPLVPVCNRPVMAYILDLLAQHGFQEVFVTLGYKPAAISSFFGDSYKGMRVHYAVEETPLGTAGSVAALREHLDSTFLVISGDGLTDVDLTALLQFHGEAGAVATLAMTRVENPLEYGVIMTDRRGRIRRFLEKPGWGEVFSDTVNTGIYVLEPSVLDGVPPGRSYDFSQHLFPALLQMEAPLYATVADGYWCDIGDSAAYLQANLDLLAGRLRFSPPGRQVVPGVWVAGDVPAGILIDGPALIGDGCHLAEGTRLEAGVVLGPATVIEGGASLRRSVTWSGVHIGAEASLVGAVLCEGVMLQAGAGVFEGAVIGASCSVGERSTISPGVRLWPKTEVDASARVDCTLVHSPSWPGRLLRRGGLLGRLGADLLPENAVRVGSAYGSVLAQSGPLVIGADEGAAATLLKQALICGAMAAGRDVLDVGVTAAPVTETAVARRNAAGGIHVRTDGALVRAVFFEAGGRPASRGTQRKLEQACCRQDFNRAAPEQAGGVVPCPEAEREYLDHLSEQINVAAVRRAGFSVGFDGAGWPVFQRWLKHLGCRVDETEPPALRICLDPIEGTWRLSSASPEAMIGLDVWLNLRYQRWTDEAVPIPVTAPRGVEALPRKWGRRAVRVRQADWRMTDPLLGVGRLLEWMAVENLTEADVLRRLPGACVAVRSVACPWEAKGRVMRRLLEEHAHTATDLVDGLRAEGPEGWVLLLPDPDEPVYQVYAEADDQESAVALAERYVRRIQELQ